jgi:hypothetical protein
MLTIFKYPIKLEECQTLEVPRGARFLDGQLQNNTMVLWALVNPDLEAEKRDIVIYGTGRPIYNHLETEYIATIQKDEFVWHIFEATCL